MMTAKRRILVIDHGNTSLKASLFEDGVPAGALRVDVPDIENLEPLISEPVSGVIYCTVSTVAHRLLESLRILTDGPVMVLTHSTPLPVSIDYGTPSTLGLDRVAAAVGATVLCPGRALAVVDTGTAMTFDIVDADSTFRGGNISPGMSLRFRSLHEATRMLPMVGPDDGVTLFGHDTESAIRSGVMFGMAAEISAMFSAARDSGLADTLVLTGGDASLLIPLLKEFGITPVAGPDLVACGLLRIFTYNEEL